MDPRRLYREIVEIEKQLRDLLRSNPLNVHDANLLRSRLTEKAQQLTDVSPAFAAAREIEQALWKPCFYKRIEDFRRRIRKYATASASDRSVREHFARVSAEFQAFLTDAAAFYESLRASWTQWLVQHRVSRIASASSSSSSQLSDAEAAQQVERCRHSLHRCLVFLGDLARYRELHNQKARKNFAAAEQFYFRALSVLPENGNPHNQLAVLATYVEAETVAVYRYCRSLLIAQPFATAEENLALLFERSRQRPLAPPMTARLTAASPAKDKSAYLKSALHRLTRLHGALFSIASREAPQQQTNNNGNTSANGSLPSGAPAPVYSKEMEALVVRDIATLVSNGALSDALLIKLLVINVFCVIRAAKTSVAMDALRLAVRVMTATMACVLSSLPEDANNSAVSIAAQRQLASVSSFADFLRLNPNVLERLEASTAPQSEPLNKRSAEEFLETLVKLLNHSAMQTTTTTQDAPPRADKLLLLKENMELRGFAPLQRLWADVPAASSKWRDDLASSAQSHSPTSSHSTASAALSDQDAWELRVWNLRRFARFLCEEYEGNPLLYAYQGQFSTSPMVVSSFGNGNARQATAPPLPSPAPPLPPPPPTFLPMGNYRRAAMDTLSNSKDSATTFGSNTPTDDFDDEVIVYQPTASPLLPPPAPRPIDHQQQQSQSHQRSGIAANQSAFSASGLSMPFSSSSYAFNSSSSSSSSVFGPPFGARSVSGPSASVSATASTSSLGFPSFQSFSGLERLSTQSGLLAGWGNEDTSPLHRQQQPQQQPQQQQRPTVTPLAAAFSGQAFVFTGHTNSNSSTGAFNNGSQYMFGDMDDLAAIEMESAMYRQKESSLSAILGGSASSSRSTSPYAMPPLTTRSASGPALASRPPPGFGAGPSATGAAPPADASERRMSQQFFTRNPFVNP
ncbi:hypothetical protein PINS_up009897 [Pythium insidiosum]|nr:hypothetical protein PINS_up009897 [Pythium insidiosum]